MVLANLITLWMWDAIGLKPRLKATTVVTKLPLRGLYRVNTFASTIIRGGSVTLVQPHGGGSASESLDFAITSAV